MSPSDNLHRIVRPHVDNLNRLFNTTISDSRLDSQTLASNPAFHQIARRVGGHLDVLELGRGAIEFSQIVTERDKRLHVVKATYIYSRDDSWVFRYEYETLVDAGKPHSHLHVRGQHPSVGQLDKFHFPSGRLSVEHLIYHVVSEFGEQCKLPLDVLLRELRSSYKSWRPTNLGLFP